MSLADDLLAEAKDLLGLAQSDLGRPKQAKLRRSISTAYYSLFSLLVDEAATEMVGSGKKRKALRGYVIRAISHRAVKDVCSGFSNRNPEDKIKKALDGHKIPADLADMARICHDLQIYRHEADYDFTRSFTKEEAISIVEEAGEAHRKWKNIRDDEATKVFLVALIIVSERPPKLGQPIKVPKSSDKRSEKANDPASE